MQKLLILVGPPGCGKTTWAKQFIEEHKNDTPRWQRISRDDLRFMCSNVDFDPKNEEFITNSERMLVRLALENGDNVVIDATNIRQKYRNFWHKLAQEIGNIEVIEKKFNVDLDTCLQRNLERERHVPENIIVDMYKRFTSSDLNDRTIYYKEYSQPQCVFVANLQNTIIVDIDGTIADNSWRNVFDASLSLRDKPIEPIVSLVNSIFDDSFYNISHISFVTGRSDRYVIQTLSWLNTLWINKEFKLYMRKSNDERPDFIVKQEIYEHYIKGSYNVLYVLDDRPSICRMYRKLGLTVLQLNHKEF